MSAADFTPDEMDAEAHRAAKAIWRIHLAACRRYNATPVRTINDCRGLVAQVLNPDVYTGEELIASHLNRMASKLWQKIQGAQITAIEQELAKAIRDG